MSFFSDFNKSNKPQDLLELRDLNTNEGENRINRLTGVAQGRINNFDRVYQYMKEELLSNKRNMDELPALLNEAKSDLDSIKDTITQLQQMQLMKQTEHQLRTQKINKLAVAFSEMKTNLSKVVTQIQEKQKASLQRRSDHEEDGQQALLQEEYHGFDEAFVEKRQQQLNQISKLMTSLNEMMVESAVKIEQQGESIMVIGNNIKSAKRNVNDAKEEINTASEVQKGSGSRMIFLCALTTLIVIVIVLLFSASSRHKA